MCRGSCSQGWLTRRSSAGVTSSEPMYSPRMASRANSAWRSSAVRAAAAAEASRSNTLRWRSVSQRATSTVITASNAVVASRGRPTVMRRGAQVARGRPITVSTMGVPISTPSVSPAHQVHQVNARRSGGSTPAHDSAAVDRLALKLQATTPPSRQKVATSRSSVSSGGPGRVRRSRAAPRPACTIAPSALTPGSSQACSAASSRDGPRCRLTRKAPSSTPGNAVRPKTITAASASPALGYSGEA